MSGNGARAQAALEIDLAPACLGPRCVLLVLGGWWLALECQCVTSLRQLTSQSHLESTQLENQTSSAT